jgi:hypothetical protein
MVLKTKGEPTSARDCDGIKNSVRSCATSPGNPQSYLSRSTTANRAETRITVAKNPTTVNIIRLVTPNFSATRPTRPSVRPSTDRVVAKDSCLTPWTASTRRTSASASPQGTGAYGLGISLLSLSLDRLAGALCLLDLAMFQNLFHGLPDRELAGDNPFPACSFFSLSPALIKVGLSTPRQNKTSLWLISGAFLNALYAFVDSHLRLGGLPFFASSIEPLRQLVAVHEPHPRGLGQL